MNLHKLYEISNYIITKIPYGYSSTYMFQLLLLNLSDHFQEFQLLRYETHKQCEL